MSTTPRTDKQSVNHIGFYSCATVPSSFARQLETELNEALAWKASALLAEREWDEQYLAKLLGAKLGESTRKVIMKRVPEILAELKEIRISEGKALDFCIGLAGQPDPINYVKNLQTKLNAANQDADRLAKAGTGINKDDDHITNEANSEWINALTAHENRIKSNSQASVKTSDTI